MNAAEFKVMIAQQDEMVADLQKDLTELEAIQSRMGHDIQHTVRELVDYLVKTKRDAIGMMRDHLRKLREMAEG